MASPAQIVANRKNSMRSTGPRTAKGKAIVSQNALKHGFFARSVLLPIESQEEFEDFCEQMHEGCQPQNIVEQILVEQMIASLWRLRRLAKVECELFDKDFDFLGKKQLCSAFCGMTADDMQILARYESCYTRNFYRALQQLQDLQKMRDMQSACMSSILAESSSKQIGNIELI